MKHYTILLAFFLMLSPALLRAQDIPITFQQSPEEIDMSISLPKDVSYALVQNKGITTITIGSSRKINEKTLKQALPPGFSLKRLIPKKTSIILQIASPGFRVESHARKKHGILVEYVPDQSVEVAENTGPPTPPMKTSLSDKTTQPTDKKGGQEQPVASRETVDPSTQPVGQLEITGTAEQSRLIFSFPEDRSMVAFLRDGHYWFVFDHPHPVEIKGNLLRSFGTLEQRLEPPLVIFELNRSPDVLARITQEEGKWIVTLGEETQVSEGPVRRDLKGELKYNEEQKPFYEIPVANPQIKYSFTDPRRGDLLVLCPLEEPGRRFEDGVAFADFEILTSLQGVVISPQTPDLEVKFSDRAITLQRQQGLRVSSRHDREESLNAQEEAQHLDFEKWYLPSEKYAETRNRLEREISEAAQSKRIEAYYNLIRFNLARGYGVESLGLLRILSDDIPGLIHDPQYLALRSVSYFLAGNSPMALHDLTSRELLPVKETHIWKGATLNTLNQTAQGTEIFADNMRQIEKLPPFLKVTVALNAAMAALKECDTGLAAQLQTIIQKTPIPPMLKQQYELLQAFLADKTEDQAEAKNLFSHVAKSHDGKASALAEIELIHRDLDTAVIGVREAIRKLESLRYSWRGSKIEWRILKDLSQLYVDDQDYKNALSTMAVALKYHPEASDFHDLSTKMTETFKDLFSDKDHQTLSPVTAVSLYQSFKSLTPKGPEGDDIIIGLAHNLQRLDLPRQAADALRARYEGEDAFNPKLAQEYAIVLLASGQSDTALKVIETAEKHKLTPEERGKLLYLKVKTLANVGKYEAALQLIQNDTSDIAERMRAGLYWKAKKWSKAAASLWVVLDKQEDEDKNPELLMSYALMLYKGKENEKLKALREKYSELMGETKHKDSFAILTTQNLTNDLKLNQLDLHLAQVDEFQKLLDGKKE